MNVRRVNDTSGMSQPGRHQRDGNALQMPRTVKFGPCPTGSQMRRPQSDQAPATNDRASAGLTTRS
jgi:hypothetical protein